MYNYVSQSLYKMRDFAGSSLTLTDRR
jgi:hypothetical protein